VLPWVSTTGRSGPNPSIEPVPTLRRVRSRGVQAGGRHQIPQQPARGPGPPFLLLGPQVGLRSVSSWSRIISSVSFARSEGAGSRSGTSNVRRSTERTGRPPPIPRPRERLNGLAQWHDSPTTVAAERRRATASASVAGSSGESIAAPTRASASPSRAPLSAIQSVRRRQRASPPGAGRSSPGRAGPPRRPGAGQRPRRTHADLWTPSSDPQTGSASAEPLVRGCSVAVRRTRVESVPSMARWIRRPVDRTPPEQHTRSVTAPARRRRVAVGHWRNRCRTSRRSRGERRAAPSPADAAAGTIVPATVQREKQALRTARGSAFAGNRRGRYCSTRRGCHATPALDGHSTVLSWRQRQRHLNHTVDADGSSCLVGAHDDQDLPRRRRPVQRTSRAVASRRRAAATGRRRPRAIAPDPKRFSDQPDRDGRVAAPAADQLQGMRARPRAGCDRGPCRRWTPSRPRHPKATACEPRQRPGREPPGAMCAGRTPTPTVDDGAREQPQTHAGSTMRRSRQRSTVMARQLWQISSRRSALAHLGRRGGPARPGDDLPAPGGERAGGDGRIGSANERARWAGAGAVGARVDSPDGRPRWPDAVARLPRGHSGRESVPLGQARPRRSRGVDRWWRPSGSVLRRTFDVPDVIPRLRSSEADRAMISTSC